MNPAQEAQQRAQAAAERIRNDGRWQRCTCAQPAEPLPDGRCSRCYGQPGDTHAAPSNTQLEPTTRDELVDQAHGLRHDVLTAVATVRTAWWELAAALHAFHDARAWEPLGYPELKHFLAEPELGLSARQFFRLTQAYRELVVVRQVPTSALEGVDLSKVEPALPALTTGDVTPDELLADARTLTTEDVREKYRGDPHAPIDPAAEPPRVQCDACGSWYTPDRNGGGPEH